MTSEGEQELLQFIKSLGFNPIRYRDQNYEIDIFVPELNIGIEYNGIYWHSDKKKSKKYHQEKSLYFAKQNIKLVHIWEDWWINNQQLVKGFITNLLGKNTHRVYARKCEIKPISYKETKDFLTKYHFQGAKSSTLYYGLFYDGELIQVLTLLNKKRGVWEIDRFATKIDFSVVGGFSKLYNYFVREVKPNKTITFSSIDLNNIYQKSVYYLAGFNFVSYTEPSYYYISPDKSKRYSRNFFQKHKLIKYDFLKEIIEKIKSENNNKYTEKEVMDKAGWYRVFNAGNFKFEKEHNK